jgi:hypothetical protein
MDNIYIYFIILIFIIVISQNKKENMCNRCNNGVRLDYYGHRKCMDWEETLRREREREI